MRQPDGILLGWPAVAEQTAIAAGMARYWRYCERFVADRLAEPRDDFTSDHARVHLDDPEALSVDEIVGVIYGLSFAGHETTTNLTTNAVRRLLEHRDQWKALCADPTLVQGAVEEVLRFASTSASARRWLGWKSASCWSCSPGTHRTSDWCPTST